MTLLADLCRRLRRREWPREGDVVYPVLEPVESNDPTGYRHPVTNWAPMPSERDQYRPEAISPHLFGGEP